MPAAHGRVGVDRGRVVASVTEAHDTFIEHACGWWPAVMRRPRPPAHQAPAKKKSAASCSWGQEVVQGHVRRTSYEPHEGDMTIHWQYISFLDSLLVFSFSERRVSFSLLWWSLECGAADWSSCSMTDCETDAGNPCPSSLFSGLQSWC
jgi:hypothetical protein